MFKKYDAASENSQTAAEARCKLRASCQKLHVKASAAANMSHWDHKHCEWSAFIFMQVCDAGRLADSEDNPKEI